VNRLTALVRRYPLVTGCLVLIVLLGVGNYFLRESQNSLSASHDTVRRNGEDMLLSLSGLSRVSQEYTSVKEATDFIDANLIREGDLAENLGYFYQLETLSKVRLTQLSQLSSQPAAADAPYVGIPFSIRASGTYRQVLRFLHELESGPRLCRVTTYSFSGGGGEDRIQLDLSIEMLGRP
jgi:Tfp pilus assembly protein PilO